MRFPHCAALTGAPGSGQAACSAIAATTRPLFGAGCERDISCRGLPCAAASMAVDWAGVVVERTFAWLSQFRRLRVRYEKRADIHEAFLSLGCALWSAINISYLRIRDESKPVGV